MPSFLFFLSVVDDHEPARRKEMRRERGRNCTFKGFRVAAVVCSTICATDTLSTSLHTKEKQQHQKLPLATPEFNPARLGVTSFVIYCYDLAADLWLLAWDCARSHKNFLPFFIFNSILLPSIAPLRICSASLWNKTIPRPLDPSIIFSSTIFLCYIGSIKQ